MVSPPPERQRTVLTPDAVPSRLLSWCLSNPQTVSPSSSSSSSLSPSPTLLPTPSAATSSHRRYPPPKPGAPRAIRDFPKNCGGPANLKPVEPNRSTIKVNQDALDSQNSKSISLRGKEKEFPPKYPPRRVLQGVSVKRRFPPHCGRNQSQPPPQQNHNPLALVPLPATSEDVVNKKRRRSPVSDRSSPRNCLVEAGEIEIRREIKDVLQLFDELTAYFRETFSAAGKGKNTKSAFMAAANHLKSMGRWVNTSRRLGKVPGVEINDEFKSRAELVVVGLHHAFINGIDTMYDEDGNLLATSIVATGDRDYGNYMESEDYLVYSGQGGNPKVSNGAVFEDQKLQGGNYALWNSMEEKKQVRVIRKKVVLGEVRYVYDGLYLVHKCEEVKSVHGNIVFQFHLMRDEDDVPRKLMHEAAFLPLTFPSFESPEMAGTSNDGECEIVNMK
ncbi:unnamed protein product [Linum trigynum]|uniref:YDG domain-containing protein n=1 Tax=Linum trigynum TaxID=586398 RepID=A0AAV2GD66_9ROSI